MKSNPAKLTHARIVDARDRVAVDGAERVIWCCEPPGFGCRIRPSGACAFIFQYRVRGGRSGPSRKLTIGKLGAFSVEEARSVARKHAQEVALGGDPQRDKMAARGVLTLRELFELWRAEEGPRLSPKTVRDAEGHLRRQLAPLARVRIDEIRKRDAARRHADLAATPYAANRALATLSTLYSFAEARELAPAGSNPAKGLKRYREAHRVRMLEAEEVAGLWGALIELQADERMRFAAPAIMLGMLTGWRVGEVRTLAWERVDMAAREAEITGKTGARRAPFPEACAALFAYLADASRAFGRGAHRGRWVFPALGGKQAELGPISDWEHEKCWRAALGRAGVSGVRRHDLRHLIAGVIGLQTGSALRVKEALGHRSIAISERYVSPIGAQQRRSTDQAAALVLAVAERERAAFGGATRLEFQDADGSLAK
ncbi:MAG: integrase family protein [Pseudomonadota bacterium]